MAKYVIYKRTRLPRRDSYSGSAWDDAGLRKEYRKTYSSQKEALNLASHLSFANPVGFSVAKIELNDAFEDILDEAYEAARAAVLKEATERPEDPRAFDCGFAWVTIPGNTSFGRYCLKQARLNEKSLDWSFRQRYGGKGYPTGCMFWNPGDSSWQSMRIIKVGAEAFAAELRKNGLEAKVGWRLD